MRLFFVLFICAISSSPFAQTAKAYLKAGDKSYNHGDFYSALKYYQEAYRLKEDNIEIAYKLAEVARQYQSFELAADYYQRVYNSEKKDQFPLTSFHLAGVYRSQGKYQDAMAYYQYFLENKGGSNRSFADDAKLYIEYSQWAMQIISEEPAVEVIHLNKRINTPYSEFGPYTVGDSLYFSSYRYQNPEDKSDPPRNISKVLLSKNGSKGRPLSRGFNEKEKLTAHTAIHPNGDKIYYTVCNYTEQGQIRCEIFFRTKDKRNRWQRPKSVGEQINVKGVTATHPSVAFDSVLNQHILFFVSDRGGAEGGLNIWMAELKKDGTATAPKPLDKINTEKNDISPFFHQHQQRLYFSSDGRKGLGGYDIYSSERVTDGWKDVEHAGYPLNSSYNDTYFFLTEDTTVAYLSSNRVGSLYLEKENKSCCNDIYKARYLPDHEDQLIPADSIPLIPDSLETEVVVEIDIPAKPPVPTKLEDFLPLALYFDNDEPDKRTRRTTTRRPYIDTYYQYIDRRQTFLDEYTANLPTDLRAIATSRLDSFFDQRVQLGYDYLIRFSEILLEKLQGGEQVEIFVKGFTSPRAKSDYNLNLGKRRVSSVRNHFETFRGGVFKAYLDRQQLVVTERSFGETTAAAGISDVLSDQRNSIYSVEASAERRVEIVEILRN